MLDFEGNEKMQENGLKLFVSLCRGPIPDLKSESNGCIGVSFRLENIEPTFDIFCADTEF
jgi:hypothetical protein